MTMGNEESLEDYKERFQLSYKRARCTLDPKSLKLVLLRGVPEDLLDTLHLLAGGDIYQIPYEDIKTVFRNHSRVAQKRRRGNPLSASATFSKHEFANEMEDLNGEMRQAIAMQLDTFRIQQKKQEAESALAIFCPRCTRKHPKNECPLHSVEVCFVCEEDHLTNQFPTLPKFKAMYQGTEATIEPLYVLNQMRSHGPKPYQQGMQGTSQAYYSPNQSAHIPSWGPPAHPSWSVLGPYTTSVTPYCY